MQLDFSMKLTHLSPAQYGFIQSYVGLYAQWMVRMLYLLNDDEKWSGRLGKKTVNESEVGKESLGESLLIKLWNFLG
jgi:hypothetical protein